MASIPNIAVGWAPGEILSSSPEAPINPKASKIEEYVGALISAREREIYTTRNTFGARKIINDLIVLGGLEKIRIFGSWAELCVAHSIVYALCKGLSVEVPHDYLLFVYAESPNNLFDRVDLYMKNETLVQEVTEFTYHFDEVNRIHNFAPVKLSQI